MNRLIHMGKRNGLLTTIIGCKKYDRMSYEDREALREKRLKSIIKYAKANSPYYEKHYKGFSENSRLEDLPVVTKSELMDNYDDWCTDRDISFAEVTKFLGERLNLGSKFSGKYYVHTTSGSTGVPLILLADKNQSNVMNAISLLRAIPSKEAMREFIQKGGRSIGVYADNGFYLGNGTIHEKLKAFPWKKKQIGIADALLPIERIVETLNEFQPVMLGGYPSCLELLIEEKESGRLKISPSIIMTGGEYLSSQLRSKLSDVFNCHVYTTYACTEGGTIACECSEGHLHICDDWMYIEAVDKDNRPLKDGELSDKILLTNLSNYTQPLIRYEVTDRIRIYHDKCGCGNISPWLEIEGRTDDIVHFSEDGQDVLVAPLAIYACLKEVHEIRRFQVKVASDNRIELLLEINQGQSRDEVCSKTCEVLKNFLANQGVHNASVVISDELPSANANGKYKHIIRV